MVDVLFGSVEAGAASGAGYTDAPGVVTDFDTVGNYAQITAKASGGGSAGLKLRAIIAGVLTTLLSFAPGSTAAAFAGNASMQAVTATNITASGQVALSANFGGAFAVGSWYRNASLGVVLSGATGTSYDFYLSAPDANPILTVATGTKNVAFAGGLTVSAGGISSAGVNPNNVASTVVLDYSSGARLIAYGPDASTLGLIQFRGRHSDGTSDTEFGRMTGGVFAWGTTSTGSGGFSAAAGDIQIANAARLRGLATGGNSYRLIGIDANNAVRIDQDGLGAVFGGSIQLGVAYAAGAPAATGYVTLKDSTGTTYKVLVST